MIYQNNEYPVLTIDSEIFDKNIANEISCQARSLGISVIIILVKKLNPNIIKNINEFSLLSNTKVYLKFVDISLCSQINNFNDCDLIYETTVTNNFKYSMEFQHVEYLNINLNVNLINIDKFKDILNFFDNYDYSSQYVIVNPIFDNNINFPKYDEITNLVDESKKLYLNNTHIDKVILVSHPCNAYACSHNICHQKKSNYPRDIFIDLKGNIYIYNINNILGNIYYDKLEDILIRNTEEFRTLTKQIFDEYIIDYPFKFFPLREMLIKEAGKGRYEY